MESIIIIRTCYPDGSYGLHALIGLMYAGGSGVRLFDEPNLKLKALNKGVFIFD